MPLPAVAPISLSDIQTEFGGTSRMGLTECYAGGNFVPAGTTGTMGAVPSSGAISLFNFLGTSVTWPGVSWTSRATLVTTFAQNAQEIFWTGSQFHMIGDASAYARSSDGITWTSNGELYSAVTNQVFYSFASSGTTLLAGAGGVGFGVATSTDNGNTWTGQPGLRATTFGTARVRAMARSGSQFLVAGDSSRVATSPDGVTWTYQAGLSTSSFNPAAVNVVIWNGTQFLIAGDSGRVAVSPDGVTWTYRGGLVSTAWSFTNVLAGVWTGTQYVLAGQQGKVATSPDGITWTNRTGLSATAWGSTVGETDCRALVWTGSQFLAGGQGARIATSPDAITWTYRPQYGLFSGMTIESAAWDGTAFIIVGNDTIRMGRSTDGGVNWDTLGSTIPNSAGNFSTTSSILSAVWTGSQFLVGGSNGTIYTSPDATTWTRQPGLSAVFGSIVPVNFAVWTGSQFLVGGGTRIASSPDGVTWVVRRISGGGQQYQAGVWTGTLVLAGTRNARVDISTDGITWVNNSNLTTTAFGTADIETVVWNGTQFLVGGTTGGGTGRIATSPDGINWTYQPGLAATSYGTTAVSRAAWSGSQFLVCGINGRIATSPDGITWTNRTALNETNFTISTAIWTGNQFLVGGSVAGGTTVGKIATSPDGITWTVRTGLLSTKFGERAVTSAVSVGATTILVGGAAGGVATSIATSP